MKKVEFTLIGLFVLSAISGTFRLSITPLLFLVSIFSLILLYFTLGFALFNGVRFRDLVKKDSYVNVKGIHILMAVLFGLALVTFYITFLFKIQHWPYRNLLYTNIALLLSFLVICLVQKLRRKENIFYNECLYRSLFYLFMSVTVTTL